MHVCWPISVEGRKKLTASHVNKSSAVLVDRVSNSSATAVIGLAVGSVAVKMAIDREASADWSNASVRLFRYVWVFSILTSTIFRVLLTNLQLINFFDQSSSINRYFNHSAYYHLSQVKISQRANSSSPFDKSYFWRKSLHCYSRCCWLCFCLRCLFVRFWAKGFIHFCFEVFWPFDRSRSSESFVEAKNKVINKITILKLPYCLIKDQKCTKIDLNKRVFIQYSHPNGIFWFDRLQKCGSIFGLSATFKKLIKLIPSKYDDIILRNSWIG